MESPERERASDWSQSFRASATAGILYQGAIAGYQLLLPGLIARRYDDAVLGAWFTLYSLFGLGVALNLGMPGALLSRMDGAAARGVTTARQLGGAIELTFLLSSGWLLVALVAPFLPSERWFDLPTRAGPGGALLAVFAYAIATMLVANLAQPVYVALFRSFQAYAVGTAVHLIALPCAIAVAILRPSFPLAAAVFLAPPIVGGALLWALGLRRRYFAIIRADRSERRALFHVGAPFLAMDAATGLILRTPEALISHAQGFVEAGYFAAFQRFPVLLSAVLIALVQPFWPSLAASARTNDARAARAIARQSLIVCLALWVLFAAAILPLGELLLRRWLGAVVSYSPRLLLLAVGFGLAQSLHYWTVLSLVGLDDRRANLRINIVMLLSYAVLGPVLTRHSGAVGTYVALIAVFGGIGVPLGVLALRARLRTMSSGATVERL